MLGPISLPVFVVILLLGANLTPAQQLGDEMSSNTRVESFYWSKLPEVDSPRFRSYVRNPPDPKTPNFPSAEEKAAIRVDKFVYSIKVRNLTDKIITSVAWSYKFVDPLSGTLIARHEFVTPVVLKPNRRKKLHGDSVSPPTPTVDVRLLELNKLEPYLESASVQKIVYKEKRVSH